MKEEKCDRCHKTMLGKYHLVKGMAICPECYEFLKKQEELLR